MRARRVAFELLQEERINHLQIPHNNLEDVHVKMQILCAPSISMVKRDISRITSCIFSVYTQRKISSSGYILQLFSVDTLTSIYDAT